MRWHTAKRSANAHRVCFIAIPRKSQLSRAQVSACNGFGHLGGSEFQLMVRSVSEVKVGEAKGSLIPTRSALPDRLPENH
jgi:hypothetical protein